MVELMSSPPNPTFSSKTVNIEVVTLTHSSSFPSLPVESELKPTKVFAVSLDRSMQGEILSISIESSPRTEVIYFDWSNLTESRLHSSVSFHISIRVTTKSILHTIVDQGASVSILSSIA